MVNFGKESVRPNFFQRTACMEIAGQIWNLRRVSLFRFYKLNSLKNRTSIYILKKSNHSASECLGESSSSTAAENSCRTDSHGQVP